MKVGPGSRNCKEDGNCGRGKASPVENNGYELERDHRIKKGRMEANGKSQETEKKGIPWGIRRCL